NEENGSMLNHSLRHEFLKFGGVIGGVWQTAIALRNSLCSERLPHQYEVQIRGIETRLEALLRKFQQQADEYREQKTPIDLEHANVTYNQGVDEWRKNLEQLLETVHQILRDSSITESHELKEDVAWLQKCQQLHLLTLKELLEKYGE